jgi:hypothetical protein
MDELGLGIGFSVGRCEERLVKEDFILMAAGGKGFENWGVCVDTAGGYGEGRGKGLASAWFRFALL